MTSTLDKLRAILWRDLLTAIRHRSGFVVTLVGVFTELAAFYFLSRAIGPGFRPGGIEYFPFLMVGTGIYTFFVMSAQAFLSSVQEAQQTGTLEVLMTTSTAPAELVILSSISAFAGNLVNLLVYLLAGVAVFRASIHANFFSCVAVLVLSLAIALALGIVAATLQVAFQKGSALLWLLGSGLWFLSGTMFPIQTLPRPLELIAAGRVRRPSSAVLGFEYGLPRAKRRTMDCQSMSWLSMGSSALPSARLRLYSSPSSRRLPYLWFPLL
jgi:ABC-type polysaccharide/polyol phosphate export permease